MSTDFLNEIFKLKLPLEFDARKLKDNADKFTSTDWTPHFNPQYYEGDWSGGARLRIPVQTSPQVEFLLKKP